jgi:hypothetical protein
MVKVEEDSCGIDSVSKASKATPTVIPFGKTYWLSKAKWGMSEASDSDSDSYDPPICHLSLFLFLFLKIPAAFDQIPTVDHLFLLHLWSPSNLILIIKLKATPVLDNGDIPSSNYQLPCKVEIVL